MHSRIRTHLTALALAAPLALPTAAQAGVTPLDPTQPSTPSAAAQAIMANPSQLAGASLPEHPYGSTDSDHANASPIGTGDAAPGLTGFPTAGSDYTILTSGDVSDIANQPPDPEEATSFSSYAHQQGNEAARGYALDFTDLRLAVNVPAGANCLALDYRFFSEEYPSYVGREFNDAFLAEKGGSSWSVGGDGTLTRPNDFATALGTEPISVNGAGPTAMYPSEVGNTYFNAATGLVTTKTPVAPGPQTIDLSILDASDDMLDSAAFVDNLRFVTESSATCRPPNDVTAVDVTPGPVVPGGGSQPAVKPVPKPTPATTKITVGSSVRFGAKGTTASLAVTVPGPGQLSATSAAVSGASASSVAKKKRRRTKASLLKPSRVAVKKAGVAKLAVRLSATGVKTLKRKGKVTVPVTVAYTPAGGGKATSTVKRITFKKPKKASRRK